MQQVRPSSSNPGESNVHQGYNLRACGNCGYDARGLPTEICPECGINIWDKKHQLRPPPSVPRVLFMSMLSLPPCVALIAVGYWLTLTSGMFVTVSLMFRMCLLLFIGCQAVVALWIACIASRAAPRQQRNHAFFRTIPTVFIIGTAFNIALVVGIVLAAGFAFTVYSYFTRP